MKIRICQKCKEPFEPTTPWGRICPQCHSWKGRGHNHRRFKVIRCPVDETGLPEYQAGATFTEIEMENSLRFGGFPTGTVLSYNGATVKVRENHLVRPDGTPFKWSRHG